jgi:hypothetical protein
LLQNSGDVKLQNLEELVGDKYDAHIDKLISKGTALESAKYCLDGRTTPGDVIPKETGLVAPGISSLFFPFA